MRRARGHVLGLALGLLAVSHTAAAQDGSASEQRARALFYEGAELYQQGDYEGALAEFRASWELRAAPVVMFNIAQTLRALHRYHEALGALRLYLDAAGPDIAPQRREAVERTMRSLERRIAPVTLVVKPAGAKIRVDGRAVGTAPLAEPLMLSAGRRTLEITAAGRVPLRDDIEVVGQRPRTVRIRLARRDAAGTIRVTSEPEGAHVRIDALEVGEAPAERRVPPGEHEIEAELDGFEDYSTAVEIRPRQELDLRAVLERDTDSITQQWWFWTGTAALVLAATVGIVVATQRREPNPVGGKEPFDEVVHALRSDASPAVGSLDAP